MGWIHAGITIMIVLAVSMVSIIILNSIIMMTVTTTTTNNDLGESFMFNYVVLILPLAFLLVPAPVAIGIIVYRKRLFFEPSDPNKGMSLPAIVTVTILGLLWSVPTYSIASFYLTVWS